MEDEPGQTQAARRVDGHQASCALLAHRWVQEGTIPHYAAVYAAALMASRADLALRDVIAICRGETVPGYELPPELRPLS